MKLSSVLFMVVLFTAAGFGQATTASPTSRGSFPVKIARTLDSSKLKEGDSVTMETVGAFKLADGTVVSMGSRLTGHVLASKARSKGDSDSELNLAFDKLEIAGGKQLSIKGVVQAVYPHAEESPEPQMAGAASNAAGGGTAGATVGTVTSDKSAPGSQASGGSGALDPKATGIQGMHDLDLNDGVLTSKGKNVKLGGGVRMIIRVEILG